MSKETCDEEILSGDVVSVFVIGDPHFKYKNLPEGQDFAERCIASARDQSPTFIVILGDTLDTHEVVRVDPHNLACEWIYQLSQIAPVYLIIGNHDLINASQFLTTKHIFNPLKKWANVTVVDKPLMASYGDLSFAFCPYVEPGRFIEALDKIVEDGDMWDLADCIFSHQEFRGCKMGAITSVVGDLWDENYPPVISGHIHDAQTVGKNVFYPGSSIQHAFGESSNKKLWMVSFDTDESPHFSVKKIDLGMKGKKIIYIDIGNVHTFDRSLAERYHIKLTLKGTSEQFTVFRRGKAYTELKRIGVKFAYDRITTDLEALEEGKMSREQVSFLGMLKKVVGTKTTPVQEVYMEMMGDSLEKKEPDIIYELVFLGSDGEEVTDSHSGEDGKELEVVVEEEEIHATVSTPI